MASLLQSGWKVSFQMENERDTSNWRETIYRRCQSRATPKFRCVESWISWPQILRYGIRHWSTIHCIKTFVLRTLLHLLIGTRTFKQLHLVQQECYFIWFVWLKSHKANGPTTTISIYLISLFVFWRSTFKDYQFQVAVIITQLVCYITSWHIFTFFPNGVAIFPRAPGGSPTRLAESVLTKDGRWIGRIRSAKQLSPV